MPRNGSGTYSLPAGNPVEPNTVIETEWANDTMEDIGNEITNSLSRTGEGGMLAPLRFYDGTESVPGIAWIDETSTGFYLEDAGEFAATVLTEAVAKFTSNGVTIPANKDLTVLGDQTVGGTLGVTGVITATGGVNGNITTSSATITGGTINGTAIGGSTAAAGAFTTLSASGAFSLSGDQVQVSEGGTGATTASGARTALGLAIGTDVPSPTGTGASGTWNISVSGNAATVSNGVYTNGSYSNPSWITSLAGSKITGDISGNAAGLTATLAIASGGTNATTEAGARANLLPSYATNALKFLRVNSGGTDVEWATEPSLGTVTSVAASGGTTGLSFSGSPITSSGTLTLGGTLAIASGGTGSATAGDARTALDVPSTTGSGASGTWGIGITGNAGTVTNGVYTSGSYSDPAWITSLAGSKITGNISGNAGGLSSTLGVSSGGTGQTTYTDGQLLIGNSTGNTLTKATLTAGSGITITNGNGSITVASTAGGGSVTSVDVSGGTTGLTTSGGPVTGSGTITLAGTLGVANGGTGATSLTSGYLVKGNGTSAASASVMYDDGTNVGIGTASPAVKLDVAQSQNAESRVALTNSNGGTAASSAYLLSNGSHTAVARLYGASYTTSGIFRQGGMLLYNDGPGGITIDTGAAQPIYFGIDNAEKMRLDASGNLGIGMTPSKKLDVTGTFGVTGAATFGVASTTQGSLVLANTSANSTTLQSSNSASAAYTITLPVSAGSNGQVLSTNGSGVTSWVTVSSPEFGTWTPSLQFGGGNTGLTTLYSTGNYVKAGRSVTYSVAIGLSNKGSSTGTAKLAGLPYSTLVSDNTKYSYNTLVPASGVTLTAGYSFFMGTWNTGSTTSFDIMEFKESNVAALSNTAFSNSTAFYASITVLTSA